jgi:uncharacterized membrane protein
MNRKVVSIVTIGVVLMAGIAGGAYLLWPRPAPEPAEPPPDPSAQKPQEALKYMASEAFEKLDDEAKKEYFDQVREASGGRGFGFRGRGADLTDEERERLRQNVRPLAMKAMEDRMSAYFELPAEEQTAYLDDIIDRMQAGREAREERRKERAEAAETAPDAETATAGNTPRRDHHRRGFTPERMKTRIETSEPEQRARHVEFFKALRNRAEERGVDFHGRRRSSR